LVSDSVNDPADFSVKPTLVGDRVVLRPFVPEDVSALRIALQDRELLRLTGSAHRSDAPLAPADPDRDEQFRRWRNAQPDRLDLAVVCRATGTCVGEVVLNEWDKGNSSCNFRIMLAGSGRDRGLGSEALRMMVGYGFERLGLHRISLEVYAFNPRARHVYEKAGFVAEGVLRDALRYDDEWIDAVVMSVLAPDWTRSGSGSGSGR
jgi:RimJ/RimL family protein N-acetyltransferase